jgi:hypothetical protein
MKINLATVLFLLYAALVSAQTLPVRSITIFKNGRSMIERTGKVKTPNGIYSARELPNALFGTYWIGAPNDALKSVFTKLDSVAVLDQNIKQSDYFKLMIGKSAKIYLSQGNSSNFSEYEGRFESIFINADKNSGLFTFQTKQGTWLTFNSDELKRTEFFENPKVALGTHTELKKRLEVTFNNANVEQDISMSYLTDNLGWTPVYRLELGAKSKGKLSLRAELVNDSEDFGLTNAVKLAVGVPNFMYSNKLSNLVNFNISDFNNLYYLSNNELNPFRNNRMLNNYNSTNYDEVTVPTNGPDDPDGNQVEDYYFYNLRSIEMPKGGRYQFPIFETEIAPVHFYECVLSNGGPNSYRDDNYGRNNPEGKYNPVIHYIEFKNNSTFPWTTGVVNQFSGTDLQPISQDKLTYTAAGGTCKVKIAETPEIKIIKTEGNIKREENVIRFFDHSYDRVTIEGQVCVINYKKEPITLKIKRKIEGKPTKSPDLDWTLKQEEATLRINSEYNIEWEITLKPGEERKWKYQYEVLMD